MERMASQTEIAIQNILLATDFSTISEKALRYAITIATSCNARIHLVHVIEPTTVETLAPAAAPEAYERLRQTAKASLNTQAHQLKDGRYETYLVNGLANEVVENLVRENHIDLVVVGTHGRRGIQKLKLGSVAEQIFRSISCPVLTVGPYTPETAPIAGLHSILFPTDLVSNESGALAHAISLAKGNNAHLMLLYIMAGVQAPPPNQREWFEESDMRRLQSLVPPDLHLPHQPECRIEYQGPTSEVILQVARDIGADLIVLSVRPEEPWATHLPDHAYRIVTGSLCPVLTVREKEAA